MIIYGIGRAMVDYYVEGRIDRDFMEKAFCPLPNGYLPSSQDRPLHVEGAVFSLVLEAIGSLNGFTLLKETGGSCVNILKTIAQLDSSASCIFSGTVGGASPSSKAEADPSFFLADEDGLFFKQSLEETGISSNLKALDGTTGRCLVLSGESMPGNKSQKQQGSAFLAMASPAVAPEIAPEQVVFPENLQYVLAEGMELDKVWFRDRLISASSPLIIACGTPFGAKNTAVFLKEWTCKHHSPNVSSSANSQQADSSDFSLLVLANDLEARVLEQEGISFLEWSARKDIIFVITHGCGGSSCYFHGTRLSVPATPLPQELTVDATGAGDVFAGAFIVHLHKHFSERNLTLQKIQASLEQSSSTASKIIQVPLCKTSIL